LFERKGVVKKRRKGEKEKRRLRFSLLKGFDFSL